MRVIVIAEPSMFNEGIEAILRQEPGLEIVGREEDPREAITLIKQASPDVILVADAEAATSLAPELIRRVGEGFCLRMVEVHLATNTLCVYCGDRQVIREAEDLVGAVRHICQPLTRDEQASLSRPSAAQPTS